MTTTFDRDAATDYARTHAHTACHDGTVSRIGSPPLSIEAERRRLGVPSGWMPMFKPDGGGGERLVFTDGTFDRVVHEWNGLGDCAHFMSRCLQAGGLRIATDWVPALESQLRGMMITKTLGLKVPDYRAEDIIATGIIQKGDVNCYFSGPGGELGGNLYTHSALFVSETTISCHTKSRFDAHWNIVPGKYRHTLIHFAHDDSARLLIRPFEHRVPGWWKVQFRGSEYFYLFKRTGSVSWTTKRPGQRNPSPEGTGYWFGKPGSNDFVICWTKSGSVERFALNGASNEATGTWNAHVENEPLTAVKM